ncbi:hypothetical protein QTP88_009233 [Uroleucon formosanum]
MAIRMNKPNHLVRLFIPDMTPGDLLAHQESTNPIQKLLRLRVDGGMKGCGGPMIALMRYPLYGDIKNAGSAAACSPERTAVVAAAAAAADSKPRPPSPSTIP